MLVIGFLFLTGCSNMKIEHYADTQPRLDLFEYFEGKTYAWGLFQTRSGEVKRRFYVDITGTIEGNVLTLDEQFVYDDGETEQRIWVIERTAPNNYQGTAGDVIGKAYGQTAGSVFNWHYTLDLPYGKSSIHVQFDDWMFLQPDGVMLNRAEVKKWGLRVGEVTLAFSKLDHRTAAGNLQ
ncbi:DUF3833 domain-containing protein [Thiomicrospira sp. R3]|uniref:DUF3833 domain-containing protein n=1 Tax=Thiomicrospira sp. R3 TaxID=3035472 RepID=UPI00259BC553|nr:DUF3833 domain-containing protein [Thiomicrospira sp. R3]WFE69795.1 DUF3833 domain-containing protein [Thiomicrospira sp. R3]